MRVSFDLDDSRMKTKPSRTGIGAMSLALSTMVAAGQVEYDTCILTHLEGAKLDVATHLIKQACYENHKAMGFGSADRRAYNDCLLQHLPGTESLQAVMAIKSACASRHK